MNRNSVNHYTGLTPLQTAAIHMPASKVPQHIITEMMKDSDEYKTIKAKNPSRKPDEWFNIFMDKHQEVAENIAIQADMSWRIRNAEMLLDLTEPDQLPSMA